MKQSQIVLKPVSDDTLNVEILDLGDPIYLDLGGPIDLDLGGPIYLDLGDRIEEIPPIRKNKTH